jgi:hypothetical protein
MRSGLLSWLAERLCKPARAVPEPIVKIDALIRQLTAGVVTPPAAEIERFDRLSRLLAARAALMRSRKTISVAPPLLVTGCVAVVAYLQLTHVPRAEVDVTVVASHAVLDVYGEGAFRAPANVAKLEMTDLSFVELRDDRGVPREWAAKPSEDLDLLLSPAPKTGQVMLQPVRPGTPQRLDIRFLPGDEASLSFAGAPFVAAVNVAGSVDATVAGEDVRVDPTAFIGHARSGTGLGVALAAAAWDTCAVCDPWPLSGLAFVSDSGEADDGPVHYAIESGTIRFVDVPSTYELHYGERTRFDPCKADPSAAPSVATDPSVLRELYLDPVKRQLRADFHLCVSDIRVGPRTAPVSLQPTRLEWLRARKGPELVLASSLALLALIGNIVRWAKGGDK